MSRTGPPKGPHRSAPTPTAYAGPTACLRCEKTFERWDRRQNRLCPSCRHALDQEPSEEPHPPLRPPKRRRGPRDDG
jgi:predicted amidophosphoribosyltransferase